MANSKRNFYEILNATSNAKADQLKSNYRQLILQCHPDKLQQQFEQTSRQNTNELKTTTAADDDDVDPNRVEFVNITEAWNCLKDPIKRKQYDAELLLNKFHTHNNIYAHIQLKEMKKQPHTGEEEDNEAEENKDQMVVEENNKTKYLYTYDCRCGGQYIVDESAEQYCRRRSTTDTNRHNKNNNDNNSVDDDDADNNKSSTQNNKNSPNNKKENKNNDGGGAGSGDNGDTNADGGKGVAFVQHTEMENDDDVDEEGGELIVECSECSLVVILNG